MKISNKLPESPQMTVKTAIKSHANDSFVKKKMTKGAAILLNLKKSV